MFRPHPMPVMVSLILVIALCNIPLSLGNLPATQPPSPSASLTPANPPAPTSVPTPVPPAPTHITKAATAAPIETFSSIADMIQDTSQTEIISLMQGLTGETPLTVDGETITLDTRREESDLAAATQYVYEFLQDQGVTASFQPWENEEEECSGRNVIGEIKGVVSPDEIVLITAHLDDQPDESQAPGADDNASGSAGVMMAASSLAGYNFERTLRFVLFTGEEDGLLGSYAYVERAADADENITAVLNLDMIGWDGNGDGIVALHTRSMDDGSANPDDAAIANAFIQVVEEYEIDQLEPQLVADDDDGSDNGSFWEFDYPAILAIEDFELEENPNYHEPTDTLQSLNINYLTGFIQAAVGTTAQLAVPVN